MQTTTFAFHYDTLPHVEKIYIQKEQILTRSKEFYECGITIFFLFYNSKEQT